MSVDYAKVHDVVIVGSGPAGYTAAIYTARAQLNQIIYEGSVTAGGALMNTTEVENFPGFENAIMGPELMEQMRKQALRFGANLVTDDIVSMKLTDDIKELEDGSGNKIRAKSVILAMGSAYKELGLENEKRLSGRGVSWCATCDGFFFRGQNIVVVGGGDSALEEAQFLTKFAAKVTIVHRRDSLRASKIMQERALNNPKIKFLWDSAIEEIVGDAKGVTGAVVKNVKTGDSKLVPTKGVFVAIGHKPATELFEKTLKLQDNGYLWVQPGTTRTSVEGVFACGDVSDATYRQAITAAGTGCMSAIEAERWMIEQGV